MAEQQKNGGDSNTESAAKNTEEKKSKTPDVSRVSKKIDLNTVEVEFGKDAKPGKFLILDGGAVHGEGVFEAGMVNATVPLSVFLPRRATHDFSVKF